MVGIYQVGQITESANPKRAAERVREQRADSESKDEVQVSSAGAYAALLTTKSNSEEDQIRAERIKKIREALDKGTYQVQQVVLQVASRITKYLQA